jgi:transcriptional antiterminator NusG
VSEHEAPGHGHAASNQGAGSTDTELLSPVSVDPSAGLLDQEPQARGLALDAPWFAVWTRARAEKSVHDQLVRKNIEAFLPTVNRWSRWKDRKKLIAWPLFTSYCFARFDPRNVLAVRMCAGVVSVVSFNGVLAPIPGEQIEAIQKLVASELKYDPCPMLHEGDPVEVLHGPLKGVVGRLIRKGPRTTMVISITMINRAVSLAIDVADVRPY